MLFKVISACLHGLHFSLSLQGLGAFMKIMAAGTLVFQIPLFFSTQGSPEEWHPTKVMRKPQVEGSPCRISLLFKEV